MSCYTGDAWLGYASMKSMEVEMKVMPMGERLIRTARETWTGPVMMDSAAVHVIVAAGVQVEAAVIVAAVYVVALISRRWKFG